jgi:GR25 family glycosyltransferase involved in LPS biosynthesis
MTNIPTFVLTLENRIDRQESVKRLLKEVDLDFKFIFSSKTDNSKFNAMSKTTQIEVAIWDSHIRAMRAMLDTESNWCLILEDDFEIKESGKFFLKNRNNIDLILENLEPFYSIFQIGSLENTYSLRSSYILSRIYRAIFRSNRFDFISHLKNSRYMSYNKRTNVNKILKKCGLNKTKILFGLRLGTHAYYINREAASKLINIFENRDADPNFMTIDQYLLKVTINLDDNPILYACRLSRSIVSQSASPSDNVNRTPVALLERK